MSFTSELCHSRGAVKLMIDQPLNEILPGFEVRKDDFIKNMLLTLYASF